MTQNRTESQQTARQKRFWKLFNQSHDEENNSLSSLKHISIELPHSRLEYHEPNYRILKL